MKSDPAMIASYYMNAVKLRIRGGRPDRMRIDKYSKRPYSKYAEVPRAQS